MSFFTKNFPPHEFACHCCGRVRVKKGLPEALQMLRDSLCKALKKTVRITLNCGYRCRKHNAETPGAARNSQHVKGAAADCAFPDCLLFEAWLAAEQIPAFAKGGIGVYPLYRECLNENCKHCFDEIEGWENTCPICGHKSRRRGNFLHLDVRGHRARWGQYMGEKIPYQDAIGMLKKGEDDGDR